MDKERYNLLMKSDSEKLTEEEIQYGWHFCIEWDERLISPDSPEFECCSCKLGESNG